MEKLTSFAASGIIRVYFRERNCFQARKGDHLMRIFKTKNYHIVAIADGKYLTAGEDNLITAEQPNEGKAQLWKLLDAGDNRYRILNTAVQKAVDIIDAGTMNGAWLHLWEQAEVTSQLWTIEEEGENVRLRSVSSGKYLDVALQDNIHLQIWEKGGENQLWELRVEEKAADEPKKDSTAIKEKEPSAIKHPDSTAIKEKEPSAIKHPDPTAIKEKEPSAIKHPDPTAIKHPDPTAIKEKEPSAIKHPDPTAIKEKEAAPIQKTQPAPTKSAAKPPVKNSRKKPRGKKNTK